MSTTDSQSQQFASKHTLEKASCLPVIGAVVLQDFWVPNRAGGTSGAQEGCSTADEEEEVLRRRHSCSFPG